MTRLLTLFSLILIGGAEAQESNAPESETAPTPNLTPHVPEDPHLRDQREDLLEELRRPPYSIDDEQVLAAIAATPREEFCAPETSRLAYENRPLPIGHAQTISQPYIVALMTETLDLEPSDKVLEIGTGSGYQAAVLSPLVDEVYTIEIVEELGEATAEKLERLGYENVHTRIGDGYRGWPEQAPFDAIIVTAAPDDVPRPLVDQLREGGRMVIPVGGGFSQELYVLEKEGGEVKRKSILPVRFVPMTGEAQEEHPD